MPVPITRRRRGVITAMAVVTVAGLSLSAVPNSSAAVPATASPDSSRPTSPLQKSPGARDGKGFYDARNVAAPGAVAIRAKALTGAAPAQVGALRAQLGPSAIIDIDPLTGTPANVTALDRFLTGPSSASPRTTALS